MRNMVRWVQGLLVCILMASFLLRAQEPQEANQTQPTETAVSPAAPDTPQPVAQQPVASMPEATPVVTPPAPEKAPTPPVEEQPASQEQPQEVKEIPQQPQQPPLGPDEIQGIDTVDISQEEAQGNWLYKRVWWERAEAKYEKIRATVNKIFEMRTGFFAKRTELDKNILDPFYIKIGLSQGELQEILAELIAKTSKETKDSKIEAKADLLEQAEDEKSELEQLQKEVQQVVKQDGEVEEAILMLVEQLNKIRRLEQQAWQNFKNIARVLDDRKARELFYKVDNAWRNIQEMQAYIEKTFSTSFDTLIERIKEKIKKIDSTILALKEKGIDLKKRVLTQEENEEEEEEAPKGFFTRYVTDPMKNFFNAVWSVIRWPYDKIMGKKEVVEEDEEEEVQEPQEETSQEEKPSESAKATQATFSTSPGKAPAAPAAVNQPQEAEESPEEESIAPTEEPEENSESSSEEPMEDEPETNVQEDEE